MRPRKTLISIGLLALLALTQSCSQANNDEAVQKVESSQPKDLYSQIQQTISIEGCSSSADCALLAVGNKPCGGPEAYLAYSKNNTDVAKLEDLGQQYSEQRKKYNQVNQVMGICVVTPKPGVSCVRNQCLTNSSQRTNIQ